MKRRLNDKERAKSNNLLDQLETIYGRKVRQKVSSVLERAERIVNDLSALPLGIVANIFSNLKVEELVLAKKLNSYFKSIIEDYQLIERKNVVISWGRNNYGKLGLTPDVVDNPTLINGIFNVKKIAHGYAFSMILLNNGILFASGNNDHGQLGRPGAGVQRYDVVPDLTGIVDVSCGNTHSAFVSKNGNVYTLGGGHKGVLSDGNTDDHHISTPFKVPGINNAVKVACGPFVTAVLLDDGRVLSCGDNSFGQLGHNGGWEVDTLTEIDNVTNIIDMSFGNHHSALINQNGELFTFGSNTRGQLGFDGDGTFVPTKVDIPSVTGFKNVSCGGGFTAAVSNNGYVYTFGANEYGQLARPDELNNPIIGINNAVKVSCGNVHIAVVTDDGDVYTSGSNIVRQLGYDTETYNKNFYVKKVPNIPKVSDVACGGPSTSVVTGPTSKASKIASKIPACIGCNMVTSQKCNVCAVEYCEKCFDKMHV